MLSDAQKEKITRAFQEKALCVRSVSPEGHSEWKRVVQTHRAEVPWEDIFEAETEGGSFTLTRGHRVFVTPVVKESMEDLKEGSTVTGVREGKVVEIPLRGVKRVAYRRFMYDLTAEDWHNFVLHTSGVLISNSPDKFYHFRPPEHEGRIGKFNRVFGQIWEDEELLVYLQTALTDWNAKPPETESLCTLDALCAHKPVWTGYIMTRAMFYALYALAINWVADEFDYSIGGISLNIDKSSKYEQMKQNAKAEWDSHVETKLQTTKLVRGLQQPRFGIGIRSAFGPHVGRGVLSPRSFL